MKECCEVSRLDERDKMVALLRNKDCTCKSVILCTLHNDLLQIANYIENKYTIYEKTHRLFIVGFLGDNIQFDCSCGKQGLGREEAIQHGNTTEYRPMRGM
jgi:hypothetical protein